MLRFKVLASVIPLMAAAVFARGEVLPGVQPCIAIGDRSMQMTMLPWLAQLHVSFTGDRAQATVRVQITDSADAADFAVVDDIDASQDRACEGTAATLLVAVSDRSKVSEPVIYLSPEGPADYRIFVNSKHFTAREAAALLVGARGAPGTTEAASL
jgi:hypothetical protein